MKKCPVSEKCGACSYMGIEYGTQLKEKQNFIKELYPKYKVDPVIGMDVPTHYRHKVYATFGYDRQGRLCAGLYAEKSHRLVFPRDCMIQHSSANAIIKDFCILAEDMKIQAYDEDRREGCLRHLYMRVSHKTGKVLLVIVIGSKVLPGSKRLVSELLKKHPEIETVILDWNNDPTSMVLSGREKILFGKGTIMDEIDGVSFRISSQSFYQVNPQQTEKLYKTAIDLAKLDKNTTVLDACCGIGTISLLAAKKAKEVVGVEIVSDAIKDAQHNAKRNHIENAEFYCDDANTFLERLLDVPDVVFLDPPRSGMSREFMVSLAEMKPKKVVYISCNPLTQARDIKNLTAKGYKVQRIVPVDMFPFTKHVETVVLLSKVQK